MQAANSSGLAQSFQGNSGEGNPQFSTDFTSKQQNRMQDGHRGGGILNMPHSYSSPEEFKKRNDALLVQQKQKFDQQKQKESWDQQEAANKQESNNRDRAGAELSNTWAANKAREKQYGMSSNRGFMGTGIGAWRNNK